MAAIESAEATRRTRRAVAGYDLTFSVPKSVSVLWALAPADVQAQIVAAHHAAIDDVLALFEPEVAATRMGVDTGDGAVAQVDVIGVSAVVFDHFDSRAGGLQLHTHAAPRGALSYPPLSGERLEVISLGLMAYRTSKEEKGK